MLDSSTYYLVCAFLSGYNPTNVRNYAPRDVGLKANSCLRRNDKGSGIKSVKTTRLPRPRCGLAMTHSKLCTLNINFRLAPYGDAVV